MTHVCARKPGHHWFRLWLIASSAPSHYLNQWWLVNWTIVNKFQWNGNQNIAIFVQENAFEYIGDWNQNTTVFIQENTFDYVCCKTLQWRHKRARWSLKITSVSIVCSTVCSGPDQRKHQSSAHWPLWGESTGDRWVPSQRASNAEMFPFYDVIMGGHFVPTSMC